MLLNTGFRVKTFNIDLATPARDCLRELQQRSSPTWSRFQPWRWISLPLCTGEHKKHCTRDCVRFWRTTWTQTRSRSAPGPTSVTSWMHFCVSWCPTGHPRGGYIQLTSRSCTLSLSSLQSKLGSVSALWDWRQAFWRSVQVWRLLGTVRFAM